MENFSKSYKWRLNKRRIIVLCLLIGFIYGLEERYHIFRLVSIVNTSASVIREDIIWRALPDSAEAFWPIVFLKYYSIKEQIEKYYPVSMELICTGWGKFKLKLIALDPYVLLRWSEKNWYLSKSGKIWRANLAVNSIVQGIVPPLRPCLVWDSNMPVPVSMEHEKGDIIQSSISIEKIETWYDELSRLGWEKQVKEIVVARIEGRTIIKIIFKNAIKPRVMLLVRDEPTEWRLIAAALNKIREDIKKQNGANYRVIVDATYEGKIIVRSRDHE